MKFSKKKSDSFRLSWLRLARSQGVGSRTFIELMKIFEDPEKALNELPEIAKRGGKKNLKVATESDIEKEIEKTNKFGADIILSCDEIYPNILKEIADPPPTLTVKGNLELLKKNKVAIVGSRNSSTNGNKFTFILASEISKAGFAIVSGLARGIDASAHKAGLNQGTIGVVAGGIDNIYPKENEYLYREMYEKGLVLTEQKFGHSPSADSFPRRNRIISGLSLGVIVVEAMQRSGTLITARFAIEQDREVFAVPGSPLDPKCHGTNSLIQDGAILVQTAQDVLETLQGAIERKAATFYQEDSANPSAFRASHKPNKIPSESDMVSARKVIMSKLTHTPIDISDIINETCLPSNIVNVAILELELAEKVERSYGNKVSLVIR